MARAAAYCAALALTAPVAMHAAGTIGNTVIVMDQHQIADMETRAKTANPREQVALYADLADNLSVLASQQIAKGELDEAQATLHRIEACSASLETGLLQQNSKGLKQTELLLHTTNRRLRDLMRSASYDVKPLVQSALKRLDKAQTALLGTIFDK